MINVFEHSDPIYDSKFKGSDLARISTVGVTSIDADDENLFYPLEHIRQKKYIYSIAESMLEKDNTLMSKIMEKTKQSAENGKIKIGFNVYSSEYDSNYVYVVASASLAQN